MPCIGFQIGFNNDGKSPIVQVDKNVLGFSNCGFIK